MNKLRLLREYFYLGVTMKAYKKIYDLGSREAPVLYIFGKLHIGEKIDTHTTLLNKILGLDLQFSTEDEALDINWNDKNITRFSDFEKEVLFGNLFEKTIYWEYFSDKKLLEKVKKNERAYRHKLLKYVRIRNF